MIVRTGFSVRDPASTICPRKSRHVASTLYKATYRYVRIEVGICRITPEMEVRATIAVGRRLLTVLNPNLCLTIP